MNHPETSQTAVGEPSPHVRQGISKSAVVFLCLYCIDEHPTKKMTIEHTLLFLVLEVLMTIVEVSVVFKICFGKVLVKP